MEAVLEKYKATIAASVWVITVIIMPLTIWFTAISYKIDDANAKIIIVDENEKVLSNKVEELEVRISDKLEAIHKDVGQIKGELKHLTNK